MSKDYLPIKESLGYKNVKQALWNVFSVNLDEISIRTGEYENFGFVFTYNGYEAIIWISSTGKHRQFEYGEGGRFTISVPNPKYPTESFLESIFFHNLLTNNELSEIVKYAFGKNEKDIEYALQVLKDYLDSDGEKVLLCK